MVQNYKKIGVIGIVSAFIFPFLICIIIAACPEEICGFSLFPNKEEWFSFWGSYAGVFVSLIIGIVTLRLTVRLDNINQENVRRQNRMSVVSNMPNMSCTKMVLSSLEDEDIPVPLNKLYLFSERNNYILSMELMPAFPPYFKVEISGMELKLFSLINNTVYNKKATVGEKDYHFTNNKEFNITINVPEDINELMKKLYISYLAITNRTPYEKTVAHLWIDFKCSNVLLEKDLGDVSFRLHFQIKSNGNIHTSEGIELHVVDRQFERVKGD